MLASPPAFSLLGMPAAVVFNDILYVLCRGPGATEPDNLTRFWYVAYDGRLWQQANIVQNTGGISNSPGAVAFNGRIYAFFNTPAGQFFFKTYDGNTWAGDQQIPNTGGCVADPGAALYNGAIYLLYQGQNSVFYFRTYDGNTWTSEMSVPNTGGISAGPATTLFTL